MNLAEGSYTTSVHSAAGLRQKGRAGNGLKTATNPGSMPRLEAVQQTGREGRERSHVGLQAGWSRDQGKGGRQMTVTTNLQGCET